MNWITIIEDTNIRNNINIKVNVIFRILADCQDNKPFGLLGGYSGVILFLYYYYQYTNKPTHLLTLHNKVEYICEELPKIGHATYCNGFSGICWLIRFLHKEQIIESSNINTTLLEMDNLIFQHMLLEMKNKNYDFFHGSLGMAYYFATSNSKIGNEAINLFLKALNEDKILNQDGSSKWLSEVFINYQHKGFVYNQSLSHGMAGIIAFLVKCIKYRKNNIAIELLKQTVLFYKNNTNPVNYRSTFSKWFNSDDDIHNESPLSWCYGDPGIAVALYNAGVLLNDNELINLSLSALIRTAQRTDVKTEHITEACFCHGSSSLCHIFNRLYQTTNIQLFKDTSLYWLNDTLQKGSHLTSKLAGYNFFDEGNLINHSSLLSGLSGVGLSLLATTGSAPPMWDECVLLS